MTVRFAGGESVTADVLIGADGIRSAVRGTLLGDRPRYSGHVMYRGIVPAEAVPELVMANRVLISVGPGQHCVSYPIAGGRLVSFAATAPGGPGGGESWSEHGNVRELVDAYDGWHPGLHRMFASSPVVTRWALHDRDPVPRWTTDRIALIGDAAHPMLPFGAQGASMGIEDAVVLARCLAAAGAGAVAGALARFEGLRRPRIDRVHRFVTGNERAHHAPSGDADRSGQWSLRERAWLFGFDPDGGDPAAAGDIAAAGDAVVAGGVR